MVVERLCVQRGGCRRLPALEMSVCAILVDGCVVWLPGLERFGGGVDDGVVVFTCCMVRFMPGKHVSLEDVFWDCFQGVHGFVDLWIALVCCE